MNLPFNGLPASRIANQYLTLEYLTQAGPRIVRLSLAGSESNLLAEIPDFSVPTPLGAYSFIGGHRLWHAPEAMPRTYIPDDSGLRSEPLPEGGVRLSQAAEALTGVQKTIEIRPAGDRPAVVLRHCLKNEGLWPIELAPWAITQLRLGGTAILPQPQGPADAGGFLPNRRLALWPYTRWSDPRLKLHAAAIIIHGQALLPPVKVGALNPLGWLAYVLEGAVFIKRFSLQENAPYPDLGCNAEIYCNDRFIELESLGPLVRLEPGQSIRHEEEWELYPSLEAAPIPDEIKALV